MHCLLCLAEQAQGGNIGEGAWQWRRLVLQAARIPLAQIPWLLTHTQAQTHKFITSGCGQKVCNILICVSAGAHLHVCGRGREREGEHTGGVSRPAPIVYGTAYNKPGHGNIRRKHLLRFLCPAIEFTMLIHNAHPLRSTHLSLSHFLSPSISLSLLLLLQVAGNPLSSPLEAQPSFKL